MRPDPHTEIREALQRCWDCGQTGGAVREAAESGLAALARLEREAAERETALAEWKLRAEDRREQADAMERRLRAWVREVEAERDRLKDVLGAIGAITEQLKLDPFDPLWQIEELVAAALAAALPAVDGSSASSTEPLGSYAPPEPTT